MLIYCIKCSRIIEEGKDHICRKRLKVIMLDPVIHTPDHPKCDDPTCPCQDDEEQDEDE